MMISRVWMPVRVSSTASTGGRCTGRLALLLLLRTLRLTGGGGGGGGCGSLLRHARLCRAAQAVTMLAERPGLCWSRISKQGKRRFQTPNALSTVFRVFMWALLYLVE